MNPTKCTTLIALLMLAYIGRADPPKNWTWRNPTPTGANMRGIVYANGQFVAVGANIRVLAYGAILTSPDGITWANQEPGLRADLYSITYGNNRFVAVSDCNAIALSSANGTNWTSSNVPIGLSSITYGNNQFVAVGEGIATSTDGNVWTARPYGYGGLSAVAYGAGRFVAVGPRGTVLTSEDGVTWTSRKSATSYDLYAVAYGNGTFVAGGEDALLTSLDGITWALASSNIFISQIAFCSNQFMAWDGANVLTSSDAITWIKHPLANTLGLGGFAYGSNQFVAVGGAGSIFTSPDGSNWSNRTAKTTGSLYDVAYGNNQFVALGQGPDSSALFVTSPDGRTWTEDSPGTFYRLYLSSIAFGNGTFVAAGPDGTIVSSTDGKNWFARQPGTHADLSAVSFGGGQFVIVGNDYQNGTILTSPDGVTWWMSAFPVTTNRLSSVAYGDNQFVIGGDRGTILTSPDGYVWTQRDTRMTHPIFKVVYGNHLFVAGVSQDAAELTSTDGTSWNYRTNYHTVPAYGSIAYGNNLYVAIGDGILTSPDGITWATTPYPPFASLNGIAFVNNSFVALGDDGAILQSDPIINLSLTPSGTSGGLSLSLEGPNGLQYTIQSSTDLVSWQTLRIFESHPLTNPTNLPQSTTVISNIVPTRGGRAFYRAYSQ